MVLLRRRNPRVCAELESFGHDDESWYKCRYDGHIENDEGLYVSDMGRFLRMKSMTVLEGMRVCVAGRNYSKTRLSAWTFFCGYDPSVVRMLFKDGDRSNVSPDNLDFVGKPLPGLLLKKGRVWTIHNFPFGLLSKSISPDDWSFDMFRQWMTAIDPAVMGRMIDDVHGAKFDGSMLEWEKKIRPDVMIEVRCADKDDLRMEILGLNTALRHLGMMLGIDYRNFLNRMQLSFNIQKGRLSIGIEERTMKVALRCP